MLSSATLFMEYEAVATRPDHLDGAKASRADVVNVLDVLAMFVEPIEIHYLWRSRLRDPDDDMVLEVAVNGRADALVTFNQADFSGVTEQFGIMIATPGDILRRG